MNKLRIRVKSVEEIVELVNICNHFISDIYVYSSATDIKLDAKSAIGLASLTIMDDMEIQMISSDENEIVRFIDSIKKFRV